MKRFDYITKSSRKLLALSACVCMMSSCQLDYENQSAITPDAAWGSEVMIQAYLTDIYSGSMPGWNFWGDGSDLITESGTGLSDWLRGNNISTSNFGKEFDYGVIDKINFLLQQLPTVSEDILSADKSDKIKGQALFWRAWRYWSYVKDLGGVPLIMTPQDVTDVESLKVKRSSTSESVAAIIKDLDDAIALLPERWSDTDYGRIDRCTAMAFKGRILLWYASPLFNRNNDASRWQAAYDANKVALDAALANGYKLLDDFSQIWQTKGSANTEAMMFRRYQYPDSYYNMYQVLPEWLTNGWACVATPTLPQLLAFPTKDGSSLAIWPQDATYNTTPLDVERLATDAAYNAEILSTLVSGMDPRFYASMSVPGTEFPSKEIQAGQQFWNAYVQTESFYQNIADFQFERNTDTSWYGCFLPKKSVTPGSDKSSSTYLGQNTFIEIRLAEVYMNLAECAANLNTGGHDYNEALELIAELRERAGIEKGTGNVGYGLDKYASQEGVRHLLINERAAEFAQEDKRYGDLRRWMRFDIINDQEYVSNLFVVFNGTLDEAKGFDWTRSMTDAETQKMFHVDFVKNVKRVEASKYNVTTDHWFMPIGSKTMARNFNNDPAMQNNEWADGGTSGTFDPLK